MTPFDYVNAVTFTKEDIYNPDDVEHNYVPFVVNRALSYFPDTILFANEINQRSHIDPQMQFDFYLNIIRKQKRYAKWAKKPTDSKNHQYCQYVCEYYNCSIAKSYEIISILTDTQLEFIKTIITCE
jgi:hypothetical protein